MSSEKNESVESLSKKADTLLDQGNVDAAYRIFEQICVLDENNADAWFMKGSINGDLGRIDEAEKDIKRALEIDPEFAEAHYNLANLHRVRGNSDQAVSHLESAVSLDDSFYEAHVMLSAITGQLGQNEKCEASSRRAARLQPDSSEANMNLANILQQIGRHEEAIEYYQRAIQLGTPAPIAYYMLARCCAITGNRMLAEENYRHFLSAQPDSAEGWLAFGALLQETGRPDEAIAALQKSIQIDPDNPQALVYLGHIYRFQGQLELAQANYRQALTFAPDSEDILFNLGATLTDKAEFQDALESFTKALHVNPAHAGALYGAGTVLQITGNYEQAIPYYQRCIQSNKDLIKAYVGLAASYVALGSQDDAIKICDEALLIDAENPELLISAAAALITLGQEQQALQYAQKALAINPGDMDARAFLSTIYNHMGDTASAYEAIRENIEGNEISGVNLALAFSSVSKSLGKQQQAVEIMEKLLQDEPELAVKSRTSLHFSLGKQYDSLRQFDSAIKHYKEGNRLKPINFNRQDHEQGISEILSYFSPACMREKRQSGNTSDKPIFIVGMPRSGTSLVEQILSSHPDVYGAGELPDIIKMTAAMQSLLSSDKSYPVCLDDINDEYLNALSDNYLSHLESLAPGAKRVTDKMPGNFMNLGLIEMLFPNARIIHCTRNPIDTSLSAYFQDFSRSHPYSYDLENLVVYYNNYRKVMRHWKDVIKLPMIEISYEDLVENQQQRSMEIIEFCGLDWDDRCIKFHENDRFVGTASYAQVRQPIYRQSVERWKNYQAHIKPLVEGLKTSAQGE